MSQTRTSIFYDLLEIEAALFQIETILPKMEIKLLEIETTLPEIETALLEIEIHTLTQSRFWLGQSMEAIFFF